MDALSVTAATGFSATGLHCGIKPEGAFDLAVVRSDSPASAAAVFTNSTTAAPTITHGRDAVADGRLQAFVVASGCANAGTGDAGLAAVDRVAVAAAVALRVDAADVLVSTTGSIGPILPDELVRKVLEDGAVELSADPNSAAAAAQAIWTTDSVSKEAARRADGYIIGGMAKGAGMVRPDMATMLAFLTTDAIVSAEALQSALRSAVDFTFNCLNIDGCQSTNDTAAVMASGASGIEPAMPEFTEHLTDVCRDLARQMANDAEGASRVVTIEICGAATVQDARDIGRLIADAALVRASFYGGDPNWGRMLAAAGATGHNVTADEVSVTYDGVMVAARGLSVDHDEEGLLASLEKGDFTVDLTVGNGEGTATIVTTDLTPEYVVFNGERS